LFPVKAVIFTTESRRQAEKGLIQWLSTVTIKAMFFTTETPFDPSTKLRMVSLPNHKLRAGGGKGGKLNFRYYLDT